MSSAKPPQDPFEMFRRLWGPLGLPVPGMAVPTLDPEEVDKRIADLRSVETWLSMNLNMVKLSISGLEVQRTALQAMRSGADAMQEAAAAAQRAQPGAGGGAAPGGAGMLWPWSMMQNPFQPEAPPEQSGGKRSTDRKG